VVISSGYLLLSRYESISDVGFLILGIEGFDRCVVSFCVDCAFVVLVVCLFVVVVVCLILGRVEKT
jgi:hypothetical protein